MDQALIPENFLHDEAREKIIQSAKLFEVAYERQAHAEMSN